MTGFEEGATNSKATRNEFGQLLRDWGVGPSPVTPSDEPPTRLMLDFSPERP